MPLIGNAVDPTDTTALLQRRTLYFGDDLMKVLSVGYGLLLMMLRMLLMLRLDRFK